MGCAFFLFVPLIYTVAFIIYIVYICFFFLARDWLLPFYTVFLVLLGGCLSFIATVLFHFHSFSSSHAASDSASSVPDVTYESALYTCRIPCYER